MKARNNLKFSFNEIHNYDKVYFLKLLNLKKY